MSTIALLTIGRENSMFFGLIKSKKQKREDSDAQEYIVLKEAAQEEIEKLKIAKAAKVAKEKEELIQFRKVIKKYGPGGIYFLAFGGEDKND